MPNKPKPPKVEHVSLWISEISDACAFFFMLGWELINDRNPRWETGQARFVMNPDGGPYIQLTTESDQKEGSAGSATHVAFKCDVDATTHEIRIFCESRSLDLVIEDVGGGKKMLQIPQLFLGVAFELVPG